MFPLSVSREWQIEKSVQLTALNAFSRVRKLLRSEPVCKRRGTGRAGARSAASQQVHRGQKHVPAVCRNSNIKVASNAATSYGNTNTGTNNTHLQLLLPDCRASVSMWRRSQTAAGLTEVHCGRRAAGRSRAVQRWQTTSRDDDVMWGEVPWHWIINNVQTLRSAI